MGIGETLVHMMNLRKKEVIVQNEPMNRKCPTCGSKMLQGRMTIDERGNKNLGLIYCPEDVGMLEDGAQAVKHESTYYDPAFYCETCEKALGEFSLRMEWGDLPKCLRTERKVSGQHCPYCSKPMEEGNFFVVFRDNYGMNWYDESVFENTYTAPLRKRSFSLRRNNNFPNAHVCKKCKKIFGTFLLLKDYRKNKGK
ncbi:MAG: hypothetical protein IJ471_08145 [Eubacterium sp.]|nr:hypothetical protein [Eubacterium sp.]